nr:hypothetical protein [Pandoravirus massiliensis]
MAGQSTSLVTRRKKRTNYIAGGSLVSSYAFVCRPCEFLGGVPFFPRSAVPFALEKMPLVPGPFDFFLIDFLFTREKGRRHGCWCCERVSLVRQSLAVGAAGGWPALLLERASNKRLKKRFVVVVCAWRFFF